MEGEHGNTESPALLQPAATNTEAPSMDQLATVNTETPAAPPLAQPAVTQKDWMSATVTTLDHTKDRAKQVQEAVKALEQQEADRLAAQRARRRIMELEAEAAAKKKHEAMMAAQERRHREVQAEALRHQQEVLRRSKKAESSALKAATAQFLKEKQERGDAKEKERVMNALNTTSQQVLSGVLECQHTISKLWAMMNLCDQRKRFREGRPQTEMFRDKVDQALEREWHMLTASREDLSSLATKGEAVRSELEILHGQLRTEQSREKSLNRMGKSCSLPVLPRQQEPTSPSSQISPTSATSPTSQTSPKDVLKRAIALIDEVDALPAQSLATIARVNSQCDGAVAEVQGSLDRRKVEVGELIKGLQEQRLGAEKTIGDAEKRIVRLKRRAQNMMESPRSSKATDDQLSSAESLLVDLKSLRASLEADLRNKCHALKIDEACRQLTKTRSGGHISKMGETQGFMRKTAREGLFVRKTAKDPTISQMPDRAA